MAFDATAFDATYNRNGAERGSAEQSPEADPIVAEVRAIREALFAAAGYDLEEFGRQIRASEAADRVTSVVRPPRAP